VDDRTTIPARRRLNGRESGQMMCRMAGCRSCGSTVEARFRFCPWCAAPLRSKLVEFFAPHPAIEGDAAKALRVSRYAATEDRTAHVRFSIWSDGTAEAAVSLSEEEAARLAGFVAPAPAHRRGLLEELRDSLRL
jgi:hypothetical protein